MHPKILLLLFTLSCFHEIRNCVSAVKPPGYVEPVKAPEKNPPKYSYNYQISGEDKGLSGHSEVRNGINTTGNYFVKTADAQQDVSYFSDDWGFHPVVKYQTKSESSQVSSHFALGKEAVDALHLTEDGKFPIPQSDIKSSQADPSSNQARPTFAVPTSHPTFQPTYQSTYQPTYQSTYAASQSPQKNFDSAPSSQPIYQPTRPTYQETVYIQPQQDIIYAEPQPQQQLQQISTQRPTVIFKQQPLEKIPQYVSSTPRAETQTFNVKFVGRPTTFRPKINEDEKSNGLPNNQKPAQLPHPFKKPIIVGEFEATTTVNREYLPPLPDHNQGQFLKEVTKVVETVNQSLDVDQVITDSIPAPRKEAPSRQFLRQFNPRGQFKYESVSTERTVVKPETLVITQRPISNKFLAPVQAGLKLANDDCTDEQTHKQHATKTIIEVQKTVNIKNVLVNQPKPRKCSDDASCSKIFIQKVEVPVPVEKVVHVDRPVEVQKIVNRPYPVEKIVHVDRPVEKIVHVDRPYPVEKVVTVEKPYPVEKIVKVPVEKIVHVDRPVEKIVHVDRPYPVEKVVHVDRPVEKIVTVEKPYPVEKIVKVPVEKIVEKPVTVEKIVHVDRPVEKIVHVDRPYPVEKVVHVDRPVEKIVHVDRPYPVEKVVKVPVEKIVHVDRPVEKVVHVDRPYPVEKVVKVPVEKIVHVDRPVEKIVHVDRPVEKIVHVDRPYPVEKVVTVEKPYPVEKIVKVPFEKIVDRPYPVEKIVHVDRPYPVEKIVKVPVEKIVEKPYPVEKIVHVDRPVEKIVHVDRPYPVEKIIEKPYPVEKIVKVPVEKIVHVDRPVEKIVTVEKIVEKPYPVEKIVHVDRPYPVEKIIHVDRPVEKIVEKIVEKPYPVEKIVEKPYPVEKIVEKPYPVEKIVHVDRPVEKIVHVKVPVEVRVPVPYPVYHEKPVVYKPLYKTKIKATIHSEPLSLKSLFGGGQRNIKHIFLTDAPKYSPAYSYPHPPTHFSGPPLKVENYHVQSLKQPEFSGYRYEKPSIPFIEKPSAPYNEKSVYGPQIAQELASPPCEHGNQPITYENEYIGPAPLIDDAWASGSSNVKRHITEDGRSLRIESGGFRPPLIPSTPIDENGKPLK